MTDRQTFTSSYRARSVSVLEGEVRRGDVSGRSLWPEIRHRPMLASRLRSATMVVERQDEP